MKRIFSLLTLILLVLATPAVAQKGKRGNDDDGNNGGFNRSGRTSRPQPTRTPRASKPQEAPKTSKPLPRALPKPQEAPKFGKPQEAPRPQPSRRFGDPQPSGQKEQEQPKPRSLRSPDGREGFNVTKPQRQTSQPPAESKLRRLPEAPRELPKPTVKPERESVQKPTPIGRDRFTSPLRPTKPELLPKSGKDDGQADDAVAKRLRRAPMKPSSGKPKDVVKDAKDQPAITAPRRGGDGGGFGLPSKKNDQPAANDAPRFEPKSQRKQPEGRTLPRFGGGDLAKPKADAKTKKAVPSLADKDVASLNAPARLRGQKSFAKKNDKGDDNRPGRFFGDRGAAPRIDAPKKTVPDFGKSKGKFDHDFKPRGGQVYGKGSYQYEYYKKPKSSWSFGLGISDGGTSLAFGYGKGCYGGFGHGGFGYSPYSSYWSPVWYSPLILHQPVYAVPVYTHYYSPWYGHAFCDPWAYNSSAFAFGYSSFGGAAFSSLSFAYSSNHWGIGFGWTSAPAYSVYAPVYDPYVTAVWTPGYYLTTTERVWQPGYYEEVVATPVVETVIDPLGNSYDSVVQPGAVDYVWHEGSYVHETRREWVPGHYRYVSAF